MNQLQDDFKRKLQEIERSRCELDILRYQMPPSHRIFTVQSRISATEAEMKELKERMIKVEAIVDDYKMRSKSIKDAISEECQPVRDAAAPLEVLQSEIVALEKKLVTETKEKDNEIKSRLNYQRIKFTSEHKHICEKQGRYYMKTQHETEERCQKALKKAETHVLNSSSDGPAHGTQSSGYRQPKLETRDDTDEESGFQEELNLTHHAAANIEQLKESEMVDGDMYAVLSRPAEISFKAPLEAQSDIIPFSNRTGVKPDVEVKSLLAEPDNDAAVAVSAGVVCQELQHDVISQQQVIVSGHGIQTTAEGWTDTAKFYVNLASAKEAEISNETEELKVKIASLKQQVDANKEESQKMEQMEEHIYEQKAELDDCKEKLAEKEEELKKLDEQRKADIQAAEEKLERERNDHEQKIAQVEEEVKSLQEQLQEKNDYYDTLKKKTDAKIKELKEKLTAKAKEATELKDQYQQLEESRMNEIAQLEQKYEEKISELKELVEARKEQARIKEEYLEMKFKNEYQGKENQRLKDVSKLKLEIKEKEMELAQKEMQIMQMQKEEETRLRKEATEKIEQLAKQHDEEKAEMERKFEEQRSIERTQSEKKFQDLVDSYEEKFRRMSSVSSTSSSEASLSMIIRSNTGQSSNGGNKEDMDTITEEAAHLSISKSDKEPEPDED